MNLASFRSEPVDQTNRLHIPLVERALKVARRMVELAKHEGKSYARFAHPVTGLELEREFRFVSERWLRKDLFNGWANILDWSFDETQKRLLFYILKMMVIEHLREQRRNIAEGNVNKDWLDRSKR
jgi:hypothetical protein